MEVETIKTADQGYAQLCGQSSWPSLILYVAYALYVGSVSDDSAAHAAYAATLALCKRTLPFWLSI